MRPGTAGRKTMKWTRYCPGCGYAMSHLDEVCPRCGLAPDAEPAETKHVEPAASQPLPYEAAEAKPKTVAQRPRSVTPLIIGIVFLLVIVGSGALCYLLTRDEVHTQPAAQLGPGALTGALPHRSHDRALPPGRSLPASGSEMALPLPSGIGTLFEAQPSPQVTPTIVMANRSDETIYVAFRGPAAVAKTMPPHGTIEFQLPRGTYSLAMWSSSVAQQQGTAVFRERTRYTSQWYIIQVAPWEAGDPIRMGDIE